MISCIGIPGRQVAVVNALSNAVFSLAILDTFGLDSHWKELRIVETTAWNGRGFFISIE